MPLCVPMEEEVIAVPVPLSVLKCHSGAVDTVTSVADPWQFGTDPETDPRIRISD